MIQQRNLYVMVLLSIVTFGLYFFYWSYKTKNELNAMGNKIPTAILTVLPFVHFYFWYRYAQAFCKSVLKSDDYLPYFLLLALLPHIGMFLVQYKTNKTVMAY